MSGDGICRQLDSAGTLQRLSFNEDCVFSFSFTILMVSDDIIIIERSISSRIFDSGHNLKKNQDKS